MPGKSFYSFDGNFRISRYHDRNNNFQAREPLIQDQFVKLEKDILLRPTEKIKDGCDPDRFLCLEGNSLKKKERS